MPDDGYLPNIDFTGVCQKASELLETGRELHADLLHTIETRTRRTQVGRWTSLSPALEAKYEAWYSLSLRLISSALPERADDFRALYKSESGYDIHHYLTLGETSHATQVASRLRNQIALVSAAEVALPSVLVDLRGTLQANLFDSELAAASSLLKNGFLRGAGAMAGVVLERHLKSACDSHGVAVGKTVTISRLNTVLKEAGVLELTDWRRIQLLGDLRNKCDHQQQKDPTKDDVTELIDGVAKIIKKVF